MSAPLRVAMTVDPYIPVPPSTYGGIERVVAGVVGELTARNYEVTLFAHPGSRTQAAHIPYGKPPHTGARARATELWQVGSRLWAERRRFDIVHSFGRLAALSPVLIDRQLPKIQSYQREIPWHGIKRAVRIAGASLQFTACSDAMWSGRDARHQYGRWSTVYNGVDLSVYTASDMVERGAPLVFLGRLERIKGAHTAVEIARLAKRPLIIAGNRVDSPEGRTYFERDIRPHLDAPGVTYAGAVDDAAKNRLLRNAAALLMPIDWEEPFGIVMVEAMACGTPVIGFRRGSVPEVIEDGLTGAIVEDGAAAARAVERVLQFDRRRIRMRCAQRFAYEAIVDGYETVYRDALARTRAPWRRAG